MLIISIVIKKLLKLFYIFYIFYFRRNVCAEYFWKLIYIKKSFPFKIKKDAIVIKSAIVIKMKTS